MSINMFEMTTNYKNPDKKEQIEMVLFAFFVEKYCGEKNPVSDGEALVHGSRKRKKGPGIGPFQRSAVHGSGRGG